MDLYKLKAGTLSAILEFSNVGYIKFQVEVISNDGLKIKTLEEVVISDNKNKIYWKPQNTRRINSYGARYPFEQVLRIENKDAKLYKDASLISFSAKVTGWHLLKKKGVMAKKNWG